MGPDERTRGWPPPARCPIAADDPAARGGRGVAGGADRADDRPPGDGPRREQEQRPNPVQDQGKPAARTAEFARETFRAAVVQPALLASPGTQRLRALTEAWLDYVQEPLFPGGCFWAATLPDFDSRPGPVRDTLARHQQEWRTLIATELRQAVTAGEIAVPDVTLAAFQIDAVLVATNIALRLGDDNATANARRVIEAVMAKPAPHTRRPRR